MLEELFPGMTDELVERGALRGDVQTSVRWCNDGLHVLKAAASGLEGLCVSRPLLEGHLRQRVRALPGVEVLEGWTASGLAAATGGGRVTGVRATGPDGVERTIDADLVVDATGRGSRAPAWLASLGYARPEEEAVEVAVGYATRTYRRRPEHLGGQLGVVLAPAPAPASERAAVMLAAEGDRWVVTLGGYGPDRPPTDPGAWLAYAASLPRSDVAEVLTRAEPLDDPVPFRYPASVRRRYDRLRRFPEGFLVFGDALCSFNPIYGQGMTVAALEALALRECLTAHPSRLAPRFFRAASRLIDVPWEIAAGSDLRFAHVRGRRTAKVRLVNRYMARVHVAAEDDAAVGLAFLRVVNLLDRPERLMAPALAWRVLRAGRHPAPTAPSAPTAPEPTVPEAAVPAV